MSSAKKPVTPERKVIDLTDPPAVERKSSKTPLVQNSQRCPWCRQFLLWGDVIDTYKGTDPDFKGWECHAECNANYLLPKKLDFIDLTDS